MMVSPIPCPIPQIEDALSPYIRSREQTTRVRQILTEQITRHVQGDLGVSHITLSTPSVALKGNSASISASSLHGQYIQALVAHRKAQQQYSDIKSELDELLRPNTTFSKPPETKYSIDTAHEYAKVLRQRRQHQKLEIIRDALITLVDSERNPSAVDIKQNVKEQLGEPPQASISNFSIGQETKSGDGDLILQLKKDLIVAKNKYAEANEGKMQNENQARSNRALDQNEALLILRDARDELISWVEGELAKISENHVDPSQAELSFLADEEEEVANGGQDPLSAEKLSNEIARLYGQYLETRKRHIETAEGAVEYVQKLECSKDTQAGASVTSPSRRRPTFSSANSGMQSTTSLQASQILPYLNSITSMTKDEALLQEQSSHLRQQMKLASSETNAVVHRLAGESLLVPPGSTTINAWTKAAQDAKAKTEEIVAENVKVGNISVANANVVLQGLRARKQALQTIKHDL